MSPDHHLIDMSFSDRRTPYGDTQEGSIKIQKIGEKDRLGKLYSPRGAKNPGRGVGTAGMARKVGREHFVKLLYVTSRWSIQDAFA
jgi:hypothetical protein